MDNLEEELRKILQADGGENSIFDDFKKIIEAEELQKETKLKNHLDDANKRLNLNIQREELEYLDEGKCGVCYTYEDKVLKVFKGTFKDFEKDGVVLEKIHEVNAYPTLHGHGDGWVLMEKIEGMTVSKAISEKYVVMAEDWKEKLIESFIYSYQNGYDPKDLSDDNLMIDKKGYVRVVDVGMFDEVVTLTEEEKKDLPPWEIPSLENSIEWLKFDIERVSEKLNIITPQEALKIGVEERNHELIQDSRRKGADIHADDVNLKEVMSVLKTGVKNTKVERDFEL